MSNLSDFVTIAADNVCLQFGIDGLPVQAASLVTSGARLYTPGADSEVVAAVLTNDQPTVECLLGAVATGARVVSIPLPSRGADLSGYFEFVGRVCRDAGASEVVAREDISHLLASAGVPTRSHTQLHVRPLVAPSDGGFELTQFSSGSTGQPKAVRLSDRALGANIAAIVLSISPRQREVCVSWLPLSHDMGLVGMLFAGLSLVGPGRAESGAVVLLSPEQFVRSPDVWLEAISQARGSITASPDFGYRLATARRSSAHPDLADLRCAIVGGEIVRSHTLASFVGAYSSSGLSPTALSPAYGMAELGLAVTMTSPAEVAREVTVATAMLANNRLAEPLTGRHTTRLVASGTPLPGYAVRCDPDGDVIGSIAVRGPSVGLDGQSGESLAGDDGWMETGDVGFIHGDRVYVCGRADDRLVVHGRNIYAPAIEAAVDAVDGVRAGRAVAVGLPTGEWVVVVEPADPSHLTGKAAAELRRTVRRAAIEVTQAQPDLVQILPRGSIPFTSSGKRQRHLVRALLVSGEIETGGR